MDLQGKIIQILPEVHTQSGKVKYGFVVETSSQYPQKIPFDVWGDDKWRQMNVAVGSTVSVSFDINGREYNGKYFVSLCAWKVTAIGSGGQQQANTQNAPQPQPQNHGGGDDNLPF